MLLMMLTYLCFILLFDHHDGLWNLDDDDDDDDDDERTDPSWRISAGLKHLQSVDA